MVMNLPDCESTFFFFFLKLFETFIYKVKVFKFSLCTLGTIYLVRTQNFPKNYISHLFSCVYEGVGT